MLLAIGIMLYPILSSMYIDSHQAKLELQYQEQVEEKGNEELLKAKEEAVNYNKAIKPGTKEDETFSQEAQIKAAKNYGNILNVNGDSVMGFIEIPKISVHLPIYHGTDDNILERGIGHLVGSSVPIGGKSTHAILTGHSGMASNKLFSDLKDLVVGDIFYIKVLDETLAYQVDQIDVVLPHEVANLRIMDGEDYVTLVTCTPYAVNTHRLLVRGTRIPYEEAENLELSASAVEVGLSTREKGLIKGVVMGLSVSIVLIVIAVVFLTVKKHKKSKMKKDN